jgi:membrane protein
MSWVERLVFYGKRVFKEVGEDDLSGAAGELAYRFFLALFPFFIFLAALGGFVANLLNVSNPTNEVMELMGDSLPSDAASVLRGELESVVNSPSATLLSIGIVAAIWSASSGVSTIVKGMNRIYEVKETRPLWRRYAMNVGLTVLGGLFVLGSITLLLVGQVAGTEVAAELGLADESATAVSLARWPIIILMLIIATAFLYWAAPNVKLPFRWITPGAVIFIIGWLIGSFLFGLYVSNFGSYNATYGTLGGIVVLLIWLYLTSFLLMLGAEINAVLAQEEAPEKLPQTAGEGATSETIPLHKREELIAQSQYGTAVITKPRQSPPRAAANPESALMEEEPDARPSKLTTVLALLVTALTFWRVASSSSKQK